MQGALVCAVGIPVEKIGNAHTGDPRDVKCGKILFGFDLKPPSKQLQGKFAKMSGTERVDSEEPASARGVASTASSDESTPNKFGDDVLEAGLKDLIEEAEQSCQPGDCEDADNDGGDACAEFASAAVLASLTEGRPSHGSASAIDELEGELEKFIAEDAEAQKPATLAEERLFFDSVSPTLQRSKTTASLAADLETNLGYLPEEAIKEAVLHSSSALGTIDLVGESECEPCAGGMESTADADAELGVMLSLWAKSLEFSIESLKSQKIASSQQKCGGRQAGVSIVELPCSEGQGPRVVLVEWTDPGKCGRIVDMDAEDNLIPVVCVGSKRKPTNFAAMAATVLVPATGVTYTRDKRSGQFAVKNKLPANWKRVIDIFRSVHSKLFDSGLQCFQNSDCVDVCDLCNLQELPGQHEAQSDENPNLPALCPLCLLHMHDCCSQRVLGFIRSPMLKASSASDQLGKMEPFPAEDFQLPDKMLSDSSRTEKDFFFQRW